MSSLGTFRKVEIDGKQQLVYTLTQADKPTSSGEAATDSDVDDLPLQPRFLCPGARIRFLKFKLKDGDGDPYDLHPLNSSPYFLSTRSGTESLLDCDHHKICKLPVVPLFSRNYEDEYYCGACQRSVFCTSYCYACHECGQKFHKECVESPLEISNPSYPFHSFQLCSYPGFVKCISCCDTSYTTMIYHCTTGEASMHPVCAMKSIPFVINREKSHPHPLTFFPTQASLVCNICAKVDQFDPTYICIECVFVIHRDCIGFPHVIRTSRHNHRITFTLSLPSRELSCGVCRQKVDNKYGAYSCGKCDAYFVHSKCALDRKVWDGKDLDGVPEEDDMIDDGEPFERIADGIILHPLHSDHQLRLKTSRAYDEKKYCRGCALPIYEGQYYSCMECDLILHETCANAPRMKRHPLHPHPLTLKNSATWESDNYERNIATLGSGDDYEEYIATLGSGDFERYIANLLSGDNEGNIATWRSGNYEGIFCCSGCSRYGNGFFYEHHIGKSSFRLDLRCASVTESFEYQGHELFLALDPRKKARCHVCKYESKDSKLNCMECDYIICFRCVTLPSKARYKCDSHFLTIRDGKEASDQLEDWCEVCEGEIKEVRVKELSRVRPTEGRFYKCNDYCCTTLHVECLLGRDMYMQPGTYTIKDYISTKYSYEIRRRAWKKVQILLNTSLSRPICIRCQRRCPFPIVFQIDDEIACSRKCIISP